MESGDYIVTLSGELGFAERETVEGLFPDPVTLHARLVIDCSSVTSMDSSTLAVIALYRQRLQMLGRDPMTHMVILAPPRVFRLLELIGLAGKIVVLPVANGEERQAAG